MCYRYTTKLGGGTLEGIEPSVSFKNKDVLPLHYKIWSGVLGGFEPPFFLSKGERDTITLQDLMSYKTIRVSLCVT